MSPWRRIPFRVQLQAAKRLLDRHARGITLVLTVIAVPSALLALTPAAIGLVSTPLDIEADAVLPDPQTVPLTFLDANGNVTGTRGGVAGDPLSLGDMPAYLPAAFIATEDRRFYHHSGVDFIGLARAVWLDARAGRYVAGGSTITQQTAKMIYHNRERTVGRKLRELVKAIRLEKSLSKPAILELYLNRLYLGDGNNGVDAAARSYFGVSARHVTLAQAAMLAALTRAPTVFSPRRDLATAQARAARVLDAMAATGAISSAVAAEAIAHPAVIIARRHDSHTYFLDAAADEAQRLIAAGAFPSGALVVRTTLEPVVQQAAETASGDALRKSGARLRFSQAALVVMRPDGALSALVGGADYATSVFDRVTQAHRQPGSAFKPFVYLAALEAGKTPWEWRDDQPVNIAGYQPANYENATYGRLRLIDALAHSVNTITVNLAQEVGIGAVATAARQAGIKSPLLETPSLALGTNDVTPLELTAAYGAFANGGHQVTPYFVTRIETAAGKILYERQPTTSEPVLAASVRRDMDEMLYTVMTSGTGTGARLAGREAGGKTGTTQDYRDAWFVGFTTDYVAGVWIGNDDNSPMRGVTGGSVPAQIWKSVMTAAEQGHSAMALDRTPGPPPDAPDSDAGSPSQDYVDEALSWEFPKTAAAESYRSASAKPDRVAQDRDSTRYESLDAQSLTANASFPPTPPAGPNRSDTIVLDR